MSSSIKSSPSRIPTRMYANVLNASSRCGVWTSSPISGCSVWIWSTIDPIGSSTSGIQTSSEPVIAGRIGRLRTQGAPRHTCSHDQHEDREQPPKRLLGESFGDLDASFDAHDRAEPDDQGGAPVEVAVPMLSPGADDNRRQDRQQRGRLRMHLRQPENEHERRHEQDAAADAEEPGQNSSGKPENDHEALAQTSRRIPTAVRRSAKQRPRVLFDSPCCNSPPSRTPPTAGRPISAAAPGLTSPWRPYAIAPAVAVSEIAPSEVPLAARPEKPTATSNGTTMIPPPTPNNALKTPATTPIASRRTLLSYGRG